MDAVISVIIPTLNEASRIGALLEALAREDTAHEVIVADGGSDDETVTIARRLGASVLSTVRGRGQKLFAGAAKARGDVLLFLHADSVFPASGLARIANAIVGQTALVGGNFHIHFDGDDNFSRWQVRFYVWIRRYGFYYGDSVLFVRRDVYDQLGGIRPIALMEDYDFVRRMEAAGETCCLRQTPLQSSSRRFRGRHPVAIVWGWIVIHLLFHLGVSPAWLARFYQSTRHRPGLKFVPLRPQS